MNNKNDFHLVRGSRDSNRHDPAAARQQLEACKLPQSLRDFKASAPHFQLDPDLETAINMALAVGAPLLLTGEPGTGKTQVAYYLGWYFGIEVFDYPVKSTSTAEDMKYDFDAVAYLHAAQHPASAKKPLIREQFLQKKALWRAYEWEAPSVLLIDEIDKAPRDFPNDLLQELDKHEFHHPFYEKLMIRPKSKPPIVVITSNAERRLPDPFLRRCIFHHIQLTQDLLQIIVKNRIGDFPHLDQATLDEAQTIFWELHSRKDLKKPSVQDKKS
jgi:MoxR-like ATPase